MTTERPRWIRLAGHARRIKEPGNRHHWRCYDGCEEPEIPLVDIVLEGTVTPKNFMTGTDPLKANALGLAAWFDCYGTVRIEDGVAHVTFADAPVEE